MQEAHLNKYDYYSDSSNSNHAPVDPDNDNYWTIQSTEVLISDESGTGADLKQETVAFHEGSAGYKEVITSTPAPFIEEDIISDAQLANFLKRPVRIASFNWLETAPINTALSTISPWALFFGDSRVAYKLNNFAYLRAKLHVKILLNASPFYYGACIAAYQPLPTLTPSTIVSDGSSRSLVPLSQRPHVWLQPQKNEGAEMVLPFLRNTNWINIRNLSEFTEMGTLQFMPYTLLQSANGAVGTGVSVQVYAWAEDVEFSGTTLALAVQSEEYQVQSDEYGTGAISRPASFVANIASYLKGAPVIGKWATATQIGASAVSNIAKMFGFTNVPVIADIMPYRPTAVPQMASTEIGHPVEKLTLDSKNELSVDPSAVGLETCDDLVVTKFAGRDSYIQRIDWSTSDAVDTLLIQARVNPNMFVTGGDTNNSIINFTPISYASQMFENWRGDIIFRFEFQASPYHKGRVRISFDPQGSSANNILNQTSSSNVVYTEIVDLSVHTSFEMRVPYQQALPYLKTPQSYLVADQPVTNSGTFSVNRDTDNGMIAMRVLNTLTAPVATSGISILMFVRAADNFELANPGQVSTTFTPFQVQSESVLVESSIAGEATKFDNARALINFGESVVSLRPLMRRQCFTHVIANTTSAARSGALAYRFHKLPPIPGYDTNGVYLANQLVGAGNSVYNYTYWTPLTWLNLCFVGYRGSVQWHFNHNLTSNTSGASAVVTRIPNNPGNNLILTVAGASTLTTSSAIAFNNLSILYDALPGSAVTNCTVNTGLSVQVPNYSRFTFQSTSADKATTGSALDGSDMDVYRYTLMASVTNLAQSGTSPTTVFVYNSIGTDYSPVFFLNCPSMYRQNIVPNPA
ncbi:hypothetical protein 2 [Hubei picorna-like virus 2]|uniref:hypothetical protein 2 n=1 Tax=Hubei picorna-like virus 2 TaxID=1923099 RepID=UPI00090C3306|nr:hypothetical protein 2 [Hubei picorna-like virus 2]APG78399.1 hypothetical protein 2 [Hubei picorna-like virus 2]